MKDFLQLLVTLSGISVQHGRVPAIAYLIVGMSLTVCQRLGSRDERKEALVNLLERSGTGTGAETSTARG